MEIAHRSGARVRADDPKALSLLIDDNVDVGDVISYLGGALHPEFEIEVYILLAHIGIVDALATWLIELADGGREVHRLGVAKPLKLYDSF